MNSAVGASGAGIPVHQQVYETLRARVLFGELPPGAAVTIQGIADELDAGLTPVREALRRLIAAGALQMQGNRRVSVPELSAAALDEIEFLRLSIEPELARRAARLAHPSDLALLKAIDGQVDTALTRGDIPGYLAQNHRFHHLINTLASAPIMSELADSLWLRFGPSMRGICVAHGTADLPDQHKAVLDALRDADGEAAAMAMRADVRQGMDFLRAAL